MNTKLNGGAAVRFERLARREDMTMATDMEHDIFADYPHGKAALKKLGDVPENFRLFYAGWLGCDVRTADTMEVRGAEFRRAKSGNNKGKMTVQIPGTQRTVFISKTDMAEFINA